MERLKIHKYLSEECYKILESVVECKRRILINSPMKTGKSTLVFNGFHEVLKSCGYELIFISPIVALIEQLEQRYPKESTPCHSGLNAVVDGRVVIVTPDSLYKVVKECEEKGKKFVLVYDEAHESELRYNFRKNLATPFKFYDNDLCMGLVCLSATPDNIINSMVWDKIFTVEVEERFYQAQITNIVTGVGYDELSITNHIHQVRKKTNHSIVARINNKKLIKNIRENLEKFGYKVNVWCRGNDEESEEDIKTYYDMLNNSLSEFDIILVTSLIDVGIEFEYNKDVSLLIFLGGTGALLDAIQFAGRFRNGVARLDVIISFVEDEGKEFRSYDDISLEKYQKANKLHEVAVKCYVGDSRLTHPYLKSIYDEDGNVVDYVVDEFAINCDVFEEYIKQIANDPKLLKGFLEQHNTFNSHEIRLMVASKKYSTNEEIKEMVMEHQLQQKSKKEQLKNDIQQIKEQVANLNDKQIEVLVCKHDEIPQDDKWIYNQMEELHNLYHSEDLKESRWRYWELQGFNKKLEKPPRDIIIMALNDKWYKEFKEQQKYNFYNNQYGIGQTMDKKPDRVERIVYSIRNKIKKLKGKEIRVDLTKNFKEELLNELKKEKSLSKLNAKSLDKHLSRVYNISLKCKNIYMISSVKREDTLDI